MVIRALLVLLFALNAGVAAWWALHREPVPPEPPPLPAGVPMLELVDVAAPAAPVPAAAACYRYGPFRQAAALDAARTVIAPRVLWTAVAEQPRAPPRAWRVVLPQASREQARATATRIGAAGFSDYFVLPEGGIDANAIALGRYRNETAARERALALAEAGFPALAQPVQGPVALWLDVATAPGFDPAGTDTGVAARPIACTGVERNGRYTIPAPA